MVRIVLPLQGAWVLSLVWELRSLMPHGPAKIRTRTQLLFLVPKQTLTDPC